VRVLQHPSTPRPPLPLGAPARSVAVLVDLRAADGLLGMTRPTAAVPPRPIALTDWQARIANDWKHLNARHDAFAKATAREFISFRFAAEYASRALVSAQLAELVDLTKVRLPEWRRALTVHADAELALYGAKAVAL
jgi:hypothetical protein